MNNYAFIFARGGSQEIKNKNIRPFHNSSLLELTIKFAKESKLFKEIFLSSDSEKILEIGKKNKINCILRPKKISTHRSHELLAWKHAVRYVENKNKNKNFQLFISLPVTSPLRKKKHLEEGIRLLKKNLSSDLVIAYSKTNRHPEFNMIRVFKNKVIKTYLNKKKYCNRQDAPKIYDLTTSFYISRPEYVKKTQNIFDGKVLGIEIPKINSIDIDEYFDFKIAEYIMKKKFIL